MVGKSETTHFKISKSYEIWMLFSSYQYSSSTAKLICYHNWEQQSTRRSISAMCNLWPAGRIRPTEVFHPASEGLINFLLIRPAEQCMRRPPGLSISVCPGSNFPGKAPADVTWYRVQKKLPESFHFLFWKCFWGYATRSVLCASGACP